MSETPERADQRDYVQLVDADGNARGQAAKLAAHTAPGQLHRAFSVFLLDSDDRLLLQRRATVKYHSGGLWSNTCCGHPAPDEVPVHAAARRTREELGVQAVGLTEVGTVTYRVVDSVSGLVEHEWNHVYVGRTPHDPSPDPQEISDWQFLPWRQVGVAMESLAFTSWFPIVWRTALPALQGRANGEAAIGDHDAP